MSEKKITLKVTVKPNGDNGWRTVCNAYPQIVGEGRSCEDALASLVEKISEEFRAGTFKLDSKLVPAVSCQITEMKANLTLGTENHTLADFAEEAEPEGDGTKYAAEEEPEIYEMKQKETEANKPLYVWERLRFLEGCAHSGCRTCGNLIPAGKCRGNEKGNVCVNYTKGAYLDERCFDCNWSAYDGEKRTCAEHQHAEVASTDVACSSFFSIKEIAKSLAKSTEALKNDKKTAESTA